VKKNEQRPGTNSDVEGKSVQPTQSSNAKKLSWEQITIILLLVTCSVLTYLVWTKPKVPRNNSTVALPTGKDSTSTSQLANQHPTTTIVPDEVNQNTALKTINNNGLNYQTCFLSTNNYCATLLHKLETGEPIRTFSRAEKRIKKMGYSPVFFTNGGIFHNPSNPVGLLISAGKKFQDLNLKDGQGNFFLKPNGVFFKKKSGEYGVLEATAFSMNQDGIIYDFATQSGPMLVIDGKIHPKFNERSKNIRLRSGVGIDQKGRIVFAISEGEVSFYEFANLFREHLNCNNALYLDGVISDFYSPSTSALPTENAYCSIIAIHLN